MRRARLLQVLVFAGGAHSGAPAVAQTAGDLLPDMIVDPAALAGVRIDTETLPGRRLLRLATSTPNMGAGALEIRGSTLLGADRQEVLQRIYRLDGSFWDRLAGTSAYHPSHAHTHFDGWAAYRLRSVLADGSAGPVVAEGDKTSFCLLDILPYEDGNHRDAGPPNYTTCGQAVQGISPGWTDIYDRELDDQWIDISELPDGPYWLEAEVDPEQHVLEAPGGDDNNLARIAIVIDGEAAAPSDPPDTGLAGNPTGNHSPEVTIVQPAAAVTWVEHAYEGLPVQWVASDADGDAVAISLFADRAQLADENTLALGGYQNLRGYAGQAVINTALLEIGTWYLFAAVTDGERTNGSWAPGSIVVYVKGDLDSDGQVDRADWVQLVQRRREMRTLPLSAVVAGWEHLLDGDRDGDVDAADVDLFRSAALRVGSSH